MSGYPLLVDIYKESTPGRNGFTVWKAYRDKTIRGFAPHLADLLPVFPVGVVHTNNSDARQLCRTYPHITVSSDS